MSKKINIKVINGIIACILVVGLDVAGALLGIRADDAQSHAKHVRVVFWECKGRSYNAYVLGSSAAASLFAAHIITNFFGFFVAPAQDESNHKKTFSKRLGILCLVCSWGLCLVGMTMLVLAAKSNNQSKISCGIAFHNYLYNGGMICFAHLLFALGYVAAAGGAFPY